MERKFHTEEFESFLREKADQYKLYPSDRVWSNINRSLHPRKKWPYVGLVILLVGLGIAVDYSLFNFKSGDHKTAANAGRESLVLTPGNSTAITEQIADVPAKSTINKKSISNQIKIPSSASSGMASPVASSSEQNNSSLEKALVLVNNPLDIASNKETANNTSSARKNEHELRIPMLMDDPTKNPPPATPKKSLWAVFPKKSKLEWILYVAPTASYRKLSGGVSDVTYFVNNAPFNGADATDASNAVTQKPSFGAEVGTAIAYRIGKHFKVKAGIQFNYTRYQLRAYDYAPEKANFGIQRFGYFADTISVISKYRNYDGVGSTWLQNQYLQVSIPLGIEWSILGNRKIQWNIGTSIQPTYNLSNNAYMLSTDYRHYGQDPSLVRKWNLNAGIETFISYNMGSLTWRVGPQFRYQILSTYQKNYPITEHLLDYGFQIGISKKLR
ncbi:MAG: hypothetical protein C5B52_02145 [Bacteroidetes bacterium]|nr:MAG: hypothetical protein C5B52_02145 [Bacteroidota bacterium]